MNTLIKNGTIVTSGEQYRGDILIKGENIAAIGTNLDGGAETVIEAAGKYIFPGGVDGHTHFKSPAMGTCTAGFETTVETIVGGTTCIIDFAPQLPGVSLVESIASHRRDSAEGQAVVDFGLHAMVQDSQEGIFQETTAMVREGIPTVKLFMAYKGTPFYSSDDIIFRMLQKSREAGILVMIHAENPDMIGILQKQMIAAGQTEPKYHAASRPPAAEGEATFRAAMMAKVAEAPVFIVHVSCYEALTAIQEARRQKVAVFGETCPHYLILGVENLSKPGFEGAKYVCSPPLRESWHQEHLWESLKTGCLQVVGSDHCGYNFHGQKELGRSNFTQIPNGCPGAENRLAILYTYGVLAGRLSLPRMVDVFATAPAKFYGLYPQKGGLVPGSDADLVIFDPDYSATISALNSGLDFTPFEGFQQKGRAEKVLLRGKLVVTGGKFVGQRGQGKFVRRAPYGTAYEGRIPNR
jgi:dihydropyrimidinase